MVRLQGAVDVVRVENVVEMWIEFSCGGRSNSVLMWSHSIWRIFVAGLRVGGSIISFLSQAWFMSSFEIHLASRGNKSK